ncbi:acylphosphatase [Desmospora activa]|uniref:acylphosphatase n=1 Tax=Desmospora activa DSM 45169 TaxID=1121389 RepID=A0A2T4ZA71_9BACL|nr:acylphosphatase [Desmospora activa]PTM58788.1 acylphosphatase [Desmospora activa DSM 45169]
MRRIHMIVYGRVQGVGFRFFVQQTANHYQVKEWVRNRDDGSVEEAQADSPALDFFVETAKQGSRYSDISDWEIREKEWDPSLENFRIRY